MQLLKTKILARFLVGIKYIITHKFILKLLIEQYSFTFSEIPKNENNCSLLITI